MTFDSRVAFYFKHRQQIEEWAELRKDAASAMDDWLAGLKPDVEQLAKTISSDVVCHVIVGPEQQWPSYRLIDASWDFGTQSDQPASVALEWVRGKTSLHGWNAPYVGVRAPRGGAISNRLRDSESFKRVRLSRKDEQVAWWPACSSILPGPEFPENAAAYRDRLLSALRGVWDAYAPVIQSVIAVPQSKAEWP